MDFFSEVHMEFSVPLQFEWSFCEVHVDFRLKMEHFCEVHMEIVSFWNSGKKVHVDFAAEDGSNEKEKA